MQNKVALGVDLGGTNMRVAAVTHDGRILTSLKTKTLVERGPRAVSDEMSQMLCKIRDEIKNQYVVIGAGIGSPGPLSRAEKKIFQTPNLPGFDGFALGLEVEKSTSLSVCLDNDAKCAAFGEGYFGAAKGLRNYVLLTFGTGIGGGILIDGKMIYGKSDGACEIGHMTLHPGGRACKCGNLGCFEQYCSATALKRRIDEVGRPELGVVELFKAWEAGEAWAESLLQDVADDLAIATASLVNIFDPQAVVFGGGVFSSGGGPLCHWVQEKIRTRCFVSNQRGLNIMASSLGGDAGVLGAASLVFRSLE